MADDLGTDLDQLLAQTGQRPLLRRFGHRQSSYEIGEVVGERMEVKMDGVGGQGTARQPGALDRTLALFDPLLGRAALVVEGHDALGRPRQIRHDERDARIKLALQAPGQRRDLTENSALRNGTTEAFCRAETGQLLMAV
jgi:hypothetical protein